MSYLAKLYPTSQSNPTLEYSNASRANLGLCFSGGGSRALTCAWGQMLGLETLNLMRTPRFMSSVSGGTWASSIYGFLPQHISTEDLLGQYVPPAKLALEDASGVVNINNFQSQYSLGHAPETMGFVELSASALYFLYKYPKEQHKWMWPSIVAKHILNPFDLRAKGELPWSSTHSFTLSQAYAKQQFPTQSPAIDNLYVLRDTRPFLMMNTNIITTVSGTKPLNSVYFPQQVTGVAAGGKGKTPNGAQVGGGMVESYGYTSTLEQNDASGEYVKVSVTQPYSLIDIVSCSSAFFAGALLNWINDQLKDKNTRAKLLQQVGEHAQTQQKTGFFHHLEDDIGDFIDGLEEKVEHWVRGPLEDLSSVIPEFNYWPLQSPSENTATKFTDGGTLENTGILGLLAQTDTGSADQQPLYVIAFDNTETPLSKKDGKIIAAGQVAPLFGIDFDEATGNYANYSQAQQDIHSPQFEGKSLIQLFDNSGEQSPFDQLIQGLYHSNCGSSDAINSAPAFHQLSLVTVENTLANVTKGRKIELLYIQNAKTLDWQNALSDKTLKQQIADGQASADPIKDFKGFPNYNTFYKIGLTAKESNALCQMWAWSVADSDSPLSNTIQTFFSQAQQK